MAIPFDVDFTAPGSASSVTVTPEAMLFDPPSQPSAVRIEWTPLDMAPEDIYKVELWAIDSYETTRILRFTDPAVTNYLYPFPRSRDETEYRIVVWVGDDEDYQTGLWGVDQHTHVMDYISLVAVEAPETERAIMQARDDFGETWTQEQTFQIPAGGLNYKELPGSLAGMDHSVSVQLFTRIDGSGVTIEQTKAAMWEIFRKKRTACLRHDRGAKSFGRINGNISWRYEYNGTISGSFDFRRTSYTEGVSG